MNSKPLQRGAFRLYIPEFNEDSIGNSRNKLITINPLSFTHKEYPTCSCGRKYVPHPNKTVCLHCAYRSK